MIAVAVLGFFLLAVFIAVGLNDAASWDRDSGLARRLLRAARIRRH
ncbi:hypothetical protein ACWGDX_02905 [Streptomyces sp. NPDC055025]